MSAPGPATLAGCNFLFEEWSFLVVGIIIGRITASYCSAVLPLRRINLFFDILRSVLIIAARLMCTILRYCGIIAMLQYKENGPECPTCKHVAKNKKKCLCVCFYRVTMIISIKVRNILTG